MRAVVVREDALVWEPVDTPQPGPGQIRIRVHAAGVNRADLMQRAGRYPPPPGAPDILGLECAGEVDAVGPGAAWAVGDRVCALLAGGGYAEQVVCPGTHALPWPGGLDAVGAAAVPEVFATAWLNLVVEAGLAAGDRVLVHAGASGVGTAAIQVGRLRGAEVWVTAGSPGKIDRCRALGAAGGADRHAGAWREALGGDFDVILDPVGGAYLSDNLASLRTGGRLVVIGLLGGRAGEVDLGRMLVKRLRLIGSVLRSRPDAEKARLMAALHAEVWPAIEAGTLSPVVHGVFAIEEADAAHREMAANGTVGKLILTLGG